MDPKEERNLFDLQLDDEGASYMKDSARWARFLAILGFVGCGIFLLAAGMYSVEFFMRLSNVESHQGNYVNAEMALLFLTVALFSFFPCLHILRFTSRMKRALYMNDQSTLNESFRSMRAAIRYIGILAIIAIGLLAVLALLAILEFVR